MANHIFLIGYRGTGKTTVARLLGEQFGWPWIDADAVLEERAGCSIRQIFATEGEPSFRDRESALLEELCRSGRQVIATGGGIVLREENRRMLKRAGKAVWLTADAQTLWKRIQDDASSLERRPPLTVGGQAEVVELLRIREPFYRECANVVVDTTDRLPEEVATEILAQLPRSSEGDADVPDGLNYPDR